MKSITPFLWFDDEAEEAARFYTSVFPNSRIGRVTRYDAASSEASGRSEGSVMTVEMELDGQSFVALNGGPMFQFTEAVSFVVNCESQEEVDHYWEALTAGGEESRCGWLKDRFGVSWQVVPSELSRLLGDPDAERAKRVTAALLKMSKLDLNVLRRAADGAEAP